MEVYSVFVLSRVSHVPSAILLLVTGLQYVCIECTCYRNCLLLTGSWLLSTGSTSVDCFARWFLLDGGHWALDIARWLLVEVP